ncbi:thioredoxin-like protein [Rozella allomycis CSF55]|uniref:Thioredoxin-like protein n=1 Tax=Rozella allomycis (strain CSF55) TaxID=988480 RepID=A0A075ARR5_ROZAC|nr:hypothetical protein O9G_006074 [Rozella allomycis CSF55]RKP19918.1 thioredoxin-like protein [Rozella allomycis CSF55]|eukprot:EPZ31213.1 hypothetical protein O9G_006074 [Rozella allomycis CSF55]
MEDTEWNDILRRKGILPPKEIEIKEEEIIRIAQEAADAKEKEIMEQKTLDELDELEDELDEVVMEEYRKKRIQELKKLAETEKYGEVIEISKPDFIRHVTEESNRAPVVVLLKKD